MEKFDIIIIGSGLGGLECGTILSREGYKVLVLEKNKQIGGNLQIFSRNKRIFDTGIHYIGGLDEGQNLNRYFKYLGIMDDLKLKKMDEDGFDVVSFEGDAQEYKYAQGYDKFIDTMVSYFPEEKEGIEQYCMKIKEVCAHFPMYRVKPMNQSPGNASYLDINARDFINSCTSNKRLQQVLAGTNVLYAGEGDETPLYVHALVINSYIESSYKCIDGGAQIARLLSRQIKEAGGKIIKRAKATDFGFSGDKIEYVQLDDGRKFYGDTFISNIHPTLTLDMIEEGRIRKAYRKRLESLENSVSVFIVFIVPKKGAIENFNCNYYHYINHDVWSGAHYEKDQWPKSYALFSGASSKDEKYAESLIVMSYMKFEDTQKWSDSYNIVSKESYRGDDYELFKKQKAELLIDELEKKFPNIRDKIQAYYTSTPLTNRDYIGTKDGALYGIKKDYKNPMKSFISPKTKVPNLLLTGQNLNMHGVLGVTIGAVTTCSEILGHQTLMKKISETTAALQKG
ncbi:phytoene desaturase family protein [Fulvivirga sediminis]|uniref:NAD(P)-binding protein n=1 Tax=Fulvivirga sediminis TaxID=2803949 RepID=A0A937JYW5_9BACT|nr:NAD(P)-binding protein [Fulvivirga sediminis]MBL3656828.1 NAD(P)-binding protein [Fulvivirga sediminis]